MKHFLKWILILTLLSSACTTAWADQWDAALRRARKEDKPVVLYFFTPACSYCQAMDREVLGEKDVASVLKQNTVYVRIDVDKRDDLGRFYGIRGYPTTTFLEPNGQRIFQIPGYVGKGDFKKLLAYVTGKHYKTISLKQFLQKQGQT